MTTRYPALCADPAFRAQMLGLPYRATWYAVTTTRRPPETPRVQRHVVNDEARAVRLWHEGGGSEFRTLDIPRGVRQMENSVD